MITKTERVKIGDCYMTVTPEQAIIIRAKIQARQEKDKQISRELRQSGLVRDCRSQLTAWTSKTYSPAPNIVKDNRTAWAESKKESIERRWQEHLNVYA